MDLSSRYSPFLKGKANIKRNLHGQVVQELGMQIMRGELKPGEPLPPEGDLAQALGVSRSVVREAVKSLSAKGMIGSRPRTGLWVTPRSNWNLLDLDVLGWYYATTPPAEFIYDLFAVRWIVEPAVAEMAAELASHLDIVEMETAYQEMQAAASLEDPDAAIAADVRFHKGVIAACQNELLVRVGELIAVGLLVSFENWAASYNATLSMHEVVLSAIRERSGTVARQAMLELLSTTRSFLDAEFGASPKNEVRSKPEAL